MSRRRGNQPYNSSQDQAIQSQEHVQVQQDNVPLSQSEGQDLLQNAQEDYQQISQLDRYQHQSVDFEQVQINPQARRKAEKDLDRRDRLNREQDDVEDYLDVEDEEQQLNRRRIYYQKQSDDDQNQQQDKRFIDFEECKGNLHLWIKDDSTKRFLKKKFKKFIQNYISDTTQKQQRIYSFKTNQMLTQNKQTLQISYEHLKRAQPILALWLGLQPAILIPQLNSILYNYLCRRSSTFKSIIPQVYVKFYDLPIVDRIPDLRVQHISKLIRVKGVVTSRSQILNQLKKVLYKCQRCGQLKGPYFVDDKTPINLGACRSCQTSGRFRKQKNRSIYRNYQKLVVQQSPSQVMPGRIPRSKQVFLTGDNVDTVKPGQQIDITGIYAIRYQISLNSKQGFPVFSTYIQSNSIRKTNDVAVFQKFEQKTYLQFSKKPNVSQIIYNSIAPSIYGHFQVKKALAFSLFGGTQKINAQKMHRVRGDINVLLLGDPGIAKSQFLKSMQKIAPRCVYATGKGASAVGLTASVRQDSQTGEWRLQAGAMVLADKGLCLIDQFDKMNEHDRTSIHEAMQQQTISISKAGIVAQLRARCSVVAAANPLQGRYNQSLSFADNVNLSDPILSRFDIVKVIKDRPNQQIDRELSTFVINTHMQNHPYLQRYDQQIDMLQSREPAFQICNQQFLKQYIKYARQKYIRTVISDKSKQMIRDFYVKLRQSSAKSGGITITPRHLQSIVRICQSHARMHLRNQTTKQDADVAIKTMLRSFIQTQKHGTATKLQRQFRYFL